MSRTIYDPIAEALNLHPIEFQFDTIEELKTSPIEYGTSGFEGHTHTQDSKQKISKALKGKRDYFFVNPEAQKKHAELMKTNNPMLGRKHSEASILKMRETKRRRDLQRAVNR
jgi:hypothetical protein